MLCYVYGAATALRKNIIIRVLTWIEILTANHSELSSPTTCRPAIAPTFVFLFFFSRPRFISAVLRVCRFSFKSLRPSKVTFYRSFISNVSYTKSRSPIFFTTLVSFIFEITVLTCNVPKLIKRRYGNIQLACRVYAKRDFFKNLIFTKSNITIVVDVPLLGIFVNYVLYTN